MKIELTRRKKLILTMIVSTIAIVVFTTITDMILYNHGVPNIDYESLLSNDYGLYLLFGVLMLVSVFFFVITGYELVKDILKGRGVKNG